MGLTSQLRPSLSRLRKNVNTEALCFMDYLLLQNYGGRNPTLACHVASVLFNVRDHSPKQHRLKLEAVFRLCFSSSPHPTSLSSSLILGVLRSLKSDRADLVVLFLWITFLLPSLGKEPFCFTVLCVCMACQHSLMCLL